MSEPLANPHFLLETAWRRIHELEAEVSRLTGVVADNARLVQANADLAEDLIRLHKRLDELTTENAYLRSECQMAKAR